MAQQRRFIYAALILAVLANIAVWCNVRDTKARWQNVPPVPGEAGALAFTLGDPQFAYRFVAIMLQNLGDTGGRSTMLKEYDYNALTKWFFLANRLDPKSDAVPVLAAYYFSAVTPPEIMRPMIAYLSAVGASPEGEKWRWLAQAVFVTRFYMKDLDYAEKLAFQLADNKNPDMPGWARQMPAFVLTARGKKEAAYDIMTATLKNSADKLAPQEVNYMRIYICTRILTPQQALEDPLCRNLPQ